MAWMREGADVERLLDDISDIWALARVVAVSEECYAADVMYEDSGQLEVAVPMDELRLHVPVVAPDVGIGSSGGGVTLGDEAIARATAGSGDVGPQQCTSALATTATDMPGLASATTSTGMTAVKVAAPGVVDHFEGIIRESLLESRELVDKARFLCADHLRFVPPARTGGGALLITAKEAPIGPLRVDAAAERQDISMGLVGASSYKPTRTQRLAVASEGELIEASLYKFANTKRLVGALEERSPQKVPALRCYDRMLTLAESELKRQARTDRQKRRDAIRGLQEAEEARRPGELDGQRRSPEEEQHCTHKAAQSHLEAVSQAEDEEEREEEEKEEKKENKERKEQKEREEKEKKDEEEEKVEDEEEEIEEDIVVEDEEEDEDDEEEAFCIDMAMQTHLAEIEKVEAEWVRMEEEARHEEARRVQEAEERKRLSEREKAERARMEEEARHMEARRIQETEQKRLAEAEKAEREARRDEETRRGQEAERKRLAEMEKAERFRMEEEARRDEEARRGQEAERKRLVEMEKAKMVRMEEEARREDEARRAQMAEQKRLAEVEKAERIRQDEKARRELARHILEVEQKRLAETDKAEGIKAEERAQRWAEAQKRLAEREKAERIRAEERAHRWAEAQKRLAEREKAERIKAEERAQRWAEAQKCLAEREKAERFEVEERARRWAEAQKRLSEKEKARSAMEVEAHSAEVVQKVTTERVEASPRSTASLPASDAELEGWSFVDAPDVLVW